MTEPDSPIERHSVVAQVHQRLRNDIVSGRLATGQLYSVATIADGLGVSRTPVREALLQLSQLGLVEFHRNRGFTVIEASVASLVEVYQLRLALEVAVVRRVASLVKRGVPVDLTEVQHQFDLLAAAGVAQDRQRFMVADRAFHEGLLVLGGNGRVRDTVATARDSLFSRGLSASGEERSWETLVAEHRAILDAVASGDTRAAGRAMSQHLRNSAAALVGQLGGAPPPGWLDGWT